MTGTEWLNSLIDSIEMEPEEWVEKYGEPKPGEHGKCIDYRWAPYHDVKVYEDGYEEWIPIGD